MTLFAQEPPSLGRKKNEMGGIYLYILTTKVKSPILFGTPGFTLMESCGSGRVRSIRQMPKHSDDHWSKFLVGETANMLTDHSGFIEYVTKTGQT